MKNNTTSEFAKVRAFYNQLKNVVATYTGGGIWVFTGELKDGTFFLHDDNFDTRILTEYPDPSNDDVWFDDWQTAHLVKDLNTEEDGAAFQLAILKFIEKYTPDRWDIDFDIIRNTAKELITQKGWR